LLLIAFGALFYVLLVLPQRRRARQQQELTARLEPGVEVMTTAGLIATVDEVTDDEVRLVVAPGVVQRYAKGAVMKVLTPAEPELTEDPPLELDEGSGTEGPGGASSDDGSSDPPAAPRES
jgi:preprotein translocase subunit YajC